MAQLAFHSADRPIPLRSRELTKRFLENIFRREKIKLASISYVFCSDNYLLQINKDFLQHDFYTDIITFGLSRPGEPVEAEVYISVDRVRDNAKELNIPYRRELLRVLFHGALHLCGYGDKKKREITIMRDREDYYLRLFEKKS